MLKILILQEINGLSDDAMEVQINGSIYFKYFLDMDLMVKSPDAKIIWLFKDKLCSLGLERVLFDEFHRFLAQQNITISKGSIVDASFVLVSVQRNTKKKMIRLKKAKLLKHLKKTSINCVRKMSMPAESRKTVRIITATKTILSLPPTNNLSVNMR